MTFKVIIIDDEPAAIEALRTVIADHPQLEIIASTHCSEEGVALINQLKPDVVFLDIDMPELTGFDVAEQTRAINYHLVFVTAFAEHALNAFETKAADFLLKPVRPSRFTRCIEKLNLHSAPLQHDPESITIHDGHTRHIIVQKHISFISSIGRYQRVVLTQEGKNKHQIESIITEETLSNFEQLLNKTIFMRIHRGYVANLTQITSLIREERNWFAKLIDVEERLSISRSNVKTLQNRVAQVPQGV